MFTKERLRSPDILRSLNVHSDNHINSIVLSADLNKLFFSFNGQNILFPAS